MIALHRASERRYRSLGGHRSWLTLHTRRGEPRDGFGALQRLDEEWRQAGVESAQLRYRDTEILTYVREGALACADATGRTSIIRAGEIHRTTSGRDLSRSEGNASSVNPLHMFQLRLQPSKHGLEPSSEQKRFSVAERRDNLCVVASPDARRGSLRLHLDAVLCSALLSPGHHVVHPLEEGRSAWVHVVQGEISLGNATLTTGDGASIINAHAVSLTARGEAEILLLDLEAPHPIPARTPARA